MLALMLMLVLVLVCSGSPTHLLLELASEAGNPSHVSVDVDFGVDAGVDAGDRFW